MTNERTNGTKRSVMNSVIRVSMAVVAASVLLLAAPTALASQISITVPIRLAASEDLDNGRELLDEREYHAAAQAFERAVAAASAQAAASAATAESASVAGVAQAAAAAQAAARAEASAALYWQSYSLNKALQYADAMVAIEELRRSYSDSRWLDDARVLEREIRDALRDRGREERDQARDQRDRARDEARLARDMARDERDRAREEHESSRDDHEDYDADHDYEYGDYDYEYEYESQEFGSGDDSGEDDMVMYALHGLMGVDPDRAIPVLERFLAGDHPRSHKQQALFVLSQTGDERAINIIMDLARDGSDPRLQVEAIQMFVMLGAPGNSGLEELYDETDDPRVKRALLQAAMVNGHGDLLMRVVQDEDAETNLRVQSVHMLGVTGDTDLLRDLYPADLPVEMRRAMLDAFGIAGDPEPVQDILRVETNPQLRAHAIRSLGIMGGSVSEIVVEIYQRLETDSEKRAAAEALMMQGDGVALRELYQQEDDPAIKRHLIQMLSVVGDDDSVDLFLDILDGTDQ
jgi:HEAT repeats